MSQETNSLRDRSPNRCLNAAGDAAKAFYPLRPPAYTAYLTRLLDHKSFLLILLIFTGLTLYNSFRLPLGEAADETDHYQYLHFVARAGHPPLTEAERQEAGFKGGLAPLYYWLTAWPVAWVGEATPPPIRRVAARPERFIPTDGLGLNHVLHTLDEQWPWRGQPLAWHLVRLLSLPMAWATLLATYLLGRRLFPTRKIIALGAVAFMAFLPRFVISSAVINDDNLVFALIACLLLIQVIILQGDHRPRTFAGLGALFGLALITKYFSLILIPEVLATLFIFQQKISVAARPPAAGKSDPPSLLRSPPAGPLLAFLAALLLTAGPWFTFITIRFNRIAELGLIPGLVAALGEPQITEGLVGLLAGEAVRPPAATYPLPAWFSLLYRSFWFEYGWMRLFAPTWVYVLFTFFLFLSLFGLIQKIRIHQKSSGPVPGGKTEKTTTNSAPVLRSTPSLLRPAAPLVWLLALHLILFILVVLARFGLSATIDTGQGRHLYPALPVIALLIALGLDYFWGWPRRFRAPLWPNQGSNAGREADPPASRPARRSLLATWPLAAVSCSLAVVVCYLTPALISLEPAAFILPHYRTLPVTITPPAALPITYRRVGPPTVPFYLAGFDVAASTTAGEALPVTLYWRIEAQVNRDYLVSLCLQDEQERPVACWRGHFGDGRYPGRAWEAGETLIDTVYIPTPVCYRLSEQRYRLQLTVWPLRTGSLIPAPAAAPIRRYTFPEPALTMRAADSLLTDRAQTVEVWRNRDRLTGPTAIEMNQALTQITYNAAMEPPVFEAVASPNRWLPLPQFETMSYLPCADGPSPFARLSHFVAHAALSPHRYQSTSQVLPPLSLSLFNRSRRLAPITSTLSFAGTLTPLSLQLPNRPALDLAANVEIDQAAPRPHYQLPLTNLPLTIRWQARRWMAEPVIVSLKLLDKDFTVGGERVAALGDRYPNVLWVPTEVVEETYPLRLSPATPPGLYRLELSLIRQAENLPAGFEYLPLDRAGASPGQNLYPLTLRLLDPAHPDSPSRPVEAQIGSAIQLTGYDLHLPAADEQIPGAALSLTLYWRSAAPVGGDYTVFTQLLGPAGRVWAQWDNPPQAGRYPTGAWTAPDKVIDRYTLRLHENAPAGEYRLLVGMYDPATGRRLPVTINGRPQPEQAIELTKFLWGRPDLR